MRHNSLIHTNVQGKSITHSPTLTHKTEYYSFIQTHIQDKGKSTAHPLTHKGIALLIHPHRIRNYSLIRLSGVYYSSTLMYKVRVTHPSTLPHKIRGRVLLIHLNSHTWEEYYSVIQTHMQDKGSVLLTHPHSHTR